MRYRLRSLMIALAVGPPVLAWVIWLAIHSSDFWLCVGILAIGFVVGLLFCIPIFRYRERVQAVVATANRRVTWIPWLLLLNPGGLVMFVAFALGAIHQGRYTFATCFGVMGALQVVSMVSVLASNRPKR
jgi:hypothetical protein